MLLRVLPVRLLFHKHSIFSSRSLWSASVTRGEKLILIGTLPARLINSVPAALQPRGRLSRHTFTREATRCPWETSDGQVPVWLVIKTAARFRFWHHVTCSRLTLGRLVSCLGDSLIAFPATSKSKTMYPSHPVKQATEQNVYTPTPGEKSHRAKCIYLHTQWNKPQSKCIYTHTQWNTPQSKTVYSNIVWNNPQNKCTYPHTLSNNSQKEKNIYTPSSLSLSSIP